VAAVEIYDQGFFEHVVRVELVSAGVFFALEVSPRGHSMPCPPDRASSAPDYA
jgi:hypothetical protein